VELALAHTPAYVAPALGGEIDVDRRQDVVWWAVVVGFAYAVALAFASWCKLTGGDPDISFGWTGFRVSCRSRS
jgi:hypothetical protein